MNGCARCGRSALARIVLPGSTLAFVKAVLVGLMAFAAYVPGAAAQSSGVSAQSSAVSAPASGVAAQASGVAVPVSGVAAQDVPRKTLSEVAGALRGRGYVFMMRHAQTEPGVGDPAHFRLDDCSTQRNLSEAGRQQARRIGKLFQDAGVRFDRVRSSQWCRCRETAQLAFGADEAWPVLNSTFRDREQQAERSRLVIEYARQMNPNHNVMLVTHQLSITPLVGGWVDSAEIVVFRHDGQRLVPLFRLVPPGVSS